MLFVTVYYALSTGSPSVHVSAEIQVRGHNTQESCLPSPILHQKISVYETFYSIRLMVNLCCKLTEKQIKIKCLLCVFDYRNISMLRFRFLKKRKASPIFICLRNAYQLCCSWICFSATVCRRHTASFVFVNCGHPTRKRDGLYPVSACSCRKEVNVK